MVTLPVASALQTRGRFPQALHMRLLVGVAILIWAFPAVVVTAADAEDVNAVSERFSCAGRAAGYYADLESGCQKYHMCGAGGRLYTYSCPNRTLFQQRVMICDHWFMVDCSLSKNYFASNALIGQKDKHFVTDNEEFYRRSQEESTLRRRDPQRTPETTSKPASRQSSVTTTPYPLRRNKVTTVDEDVTTKRTQEFIRQSISEEGEEDKLYPQFGDKKLDGKLPIVKFPQASKKVGIQAVLPGKKEEKVLPKEYTNNPFFKSLTVVPTPAAVFTTNKGQYVPLTSASPIRKDHQNLFGSRQDSNGAYTSTLTRTLDSTPSSLSSRPALITVSTTTLRAELGNTFPNYRELTPTVITTKQPPTSGHTLVTAQGHANQFVNDLPRLPNAVSNGIANGGTVSERAPLTTQYEYLNTERISFTTEADVLDEDSGADPILTQQQQQHNHDVLDEELSSNTVELRIADTRHMFYIPDSPSRHAEMLSTNNETVLTISLAAPRHHGAMRFKGAKSARGRNDDCPQCHPAFLLPGKCQPCVLIR